MPMDDRDTLARTPAGRAEEGPAPGGAEEAEEEGGEGRARVGRRAARDEARRVQRRRDRQLDRQRRRREGTAEAVEACDEGDEPVLSDKTKRVAAPTASNPERATRLRVVSYNVACGQWATPEMIADVLRPLDPDVVLLSEVPRANKGVEAKDWSRRMADALDLPHVHVGTSSSAGHKAPVWEDVTGQYGGKFKSILSKTPLSNGRDIMVEGSGWKRVSAVRAETEIGGRRFALYSLHFPGYAHHAKQPVEEDQGRSRKTRHYPDAWEKSKHKQLADRINAEDGSRDVIVGGDFNEWTDSLIMRSLSKETQLKDAITERSIDHILHSASVELVEAVREWGPKNVNSQNVKKEGCLSDHPWLWCEFEIPACTDSSACE